MREILFRGKRMDNGEWVEGSLMIAKDGKTGKDFAEVLFKGKKGYGVFWCEVDMETIGQWTGLVDKNGVKIFEGDIVRHYNKIDIGMPNEYDVGEIRWYKKGCRFDRTSNNGKGHALIGQHCVYEVIGNIHDKAVEDLLKLEVME